MSDRFRITTEPLDEERIREDLDCPADGAVVLFAGIVRAENRGRRVRHLEYECYEPMAVKVLEQVAAGAREMFGAERLRVHHRVGRVEIGEASVLVAVAAPHRGRAFDAARHTMDEIKRIVPIWKREVFEDGEVWVEGPKEPVTE